VVTPSVRLDPAERVLDWTAARAWRDEQRGPVVFTNGVFDLLHPGHLDVLRGARAEGDALVVALNTDASVRRLKGPSRPVRAEQARALVVAALACVDVVVLFDDDTPARLIAHLEPDVLVKGGDYAPDAIVGADVVRARGGRVVVVALTPGHSTTGTVARIAASVAAADG
jgi:D-beta-D-heptose 7-phosphate kinase/D-beta-D-heptose 1-phosphate adenosyltransferase